MIFCQFTGGFGFQGSRLWVCNLNEFQFPMFPLTL